MHSFVPNVSRPPKRATLLPVGQVLSLVQDQRAREVLPEVLYELRRRARTVGQLQLGQVSKLDQVGEAGGRQEGVACKKRGVDQPPANPFTLFLYVQ